jgi:hypothetical protein
MIRRLFKAKGEIGLGKATSYRKKIKQNNQEAATLAAISEGFHNHSE